MRILYLNPGGQMGGAETSLRELLASVRASKPDWELSLVLGQDGPLASLARDLGVRVIVAQFPRDLARQGEIRNKRVSTVWHVLKAVAGAALYVRRLAAIVRTVRPDLIHTNGLKMHLLGIWACGPRTPVIWHIHDYAGARPLTGCLLRRLAGRCAAAIANSKSVAADLRSVTPDLKVVSIYNAIDLERFSPTGKHLDLDALSGLAPAAPGTIRVGLVATFARWKGHEFFLQALSCLPADAPIRGYVIGGPIYETEGSQWSLVELQLEASRLGLADKVGFTGFVDDAAAAMRSLDIIVHASTQPEPFGMVIIEGMACGKPVIASEAGGAGELFEHGKDALGHPTGDVQALTDEISRLAGDRSLRISLGRAGRAKAERLFNKIRLSAEIVALYEAATGMTTFTKADVMSCAH